MSSTSINRTTIVGNLTRDPELRALASGTSVCSMRLACNTRRRAAGDEGWDDKPNYFDVTVWGPQGETCARYLNKGRQIGVDGRLEWREWETADGHHREAVEIVADTVQFLGAPASAGSAVNGDEPLGVGVGDDDGGLSF